MAVILFYGGVHLVNAYLWETQRRDPGGHRRRNADVQADPQINSCASSYFTLAFEGFHARYTETHAVTEQTARALLNVDFRLVEAAVMTALGQPVPVW
jgi:hypothetical protein